jgi:phage-related protein
MPVILPAGMAVEIAKPFGFGEIVLLDIQTVDGTQFFLTEKGDIYPTRLTGANVTYTSWIKSAGPIRMSRDFTADAGDIVLHNLDGNTIDRNVATAIKNHEFEGAYAILRIWSPLIAAAIFEFHGTLTEPNPKEEEAIFRMLQLTDVTQFSVAEDVVGELCTWRFKSAQCGSTGSAVVCKKRFIDCSDATRLATERFNGILAPPPSNAIVNTPPVVTTPGRPGDNGDGPRRRGCVEEGTPVEFYPDSEVTEERLPCSDWIEIDVPGEAQPLAMHPGTLVSVFKRASELEAGELIETTKGQFFRCGPPRKVTRLSTKIKRLVKPWRTYFARTVRLHNFKLDQEE